MPSSKKNNNRMKNLRRRFENLKKTNNNTFNIINSLEDIGSKSNKLLIKHAHFNKIKSQRNPEVSAIMLEELIDEYNKLINSCDIYNSSSIKKLQKSLIKNVSQLRKNELPLLERITKEPTMEELTFRFNKLTKFTDKNRASRKFKKQSQRKNNKSKSKSKSFFSALFS
tara:strand:- start:111 stop:617 length:507 start_codon:yes stop_codon:yes gene_type:complete